MPPTTPGLHHVTAIAGDPTENAAFYVERLGLRMVKRTVNHDDTGTYHFYFGDGAGTPGTNITFFPWTDQGRQGQFGAGQTAATAFAIPPASVDYWTDRLTAVEETERFSETVLSVEDPDGITIELVATEAAADADWEPWTDGPVPVEHQLRGFDSVTLAVERFEPTAEILTDVLGYEFDAEVGDRRRYVADGPRPGSIVDLVLTDAGRGRMGVGTVHHIAFEAQDNDEQAAWRETYAERDLRCSEIIDRTYFDAIYCREPGGVLFEIATIEPGFTADEDSAELGQRLVLPEWLEDERADIEAKLPPFERPEGT